MRSPLITLTTDFGTSDGYVAAMKGVILGITPEARIVDITHEIAPQAVAQAAFVLRTAVPYFPADTIHLAVVDPGVGTSRRAIGLQAEAAIFVGPDNGLFSGVLGDEVIDAAGTLRAALAVELRAKEYRLPAVSTTFHGRDVFAPAAAYLARGVPLSALGPALTTVTKLEQAEPLRKAGAVVGVIVHIDHFGNAVSNVRPNDLPLAPVFTCRGAVIHGLSSTYQDGLLVALVGSSGLIEVAAQNGSAAALLGLQIGDEIVVRGDE